MARYYMHKEAYQHPVKVQMEAMLVKIFARARELYLTGKPLFADEIMLKLFDKKEISVNEYTSIDDYFMYFHMTKWKNHSDSVLSHMCRAFLDRKKYKRYRKTENIPELSEVLDQNLRSCGMEAADWNREYGYIKRTVSFGIYDRNKDNIWVKMKDGSIKDISEVSYVFRSMDMERPYERTIECFSSELLMARFGECILEGLC